MNNFRNHATGRAELDFNRQIRLISEEIREERAREQRAMGIDLTRQTSRIEKRKVKMLRTLRTMVSVTLLENDCPICFESFESDAKVVVLGCNKLHMLHEKCYDMFIMTNTKNGVESVCPMCRAPIDKSAATKKILEKKAEIKRQDSFKSDQSIDADISSKGLGVTIQRMKNENQDYETPEVVAPSPSSNMDFHPPN